MAAKSSSPVTTVYQCSECDHCSQNLEEATLHAVQVHGEDRDDDDYQEESDEEPFPKIQIKEDKDLLFSDEDSISLFRQANGLDDEGPGNNSWSYGATKLLIESISDHCSNLKGKKRRSIWEQIKLSLESQIPGITSQKCETKWKQLITSQKRYLLNSSKSVGKSKHKKPEFFNDIAELFGENFPDICNYNDSDSSQQSVVYKTGNRDKKDILSAALQTENNFDSLESNTPGKETILLLSRLVSLLEKRETSNEKFQLEVLEIEREKLKCIQKFIENKEKHNARRCQLMKDYILSNPRNKRKREDND